MSIEDGDAHGAKVVRCNVRDLYMNAVEARGGCDSIDIDAVNRATGTERQIVRQAGGTDSRQGPDAFKKLAIELAILRLGVAETARIKMGDGNVTGAEAGIDGAGVEQALHAEAGADQQHQAYGDLRDDDAAAQAGTARAGELPLVFQGGQKVAARGAQCGHDAEENPSEKCGCEGEGEYAPIQRDFKGDRNAGGFEAEQKRNGPPCDGESADATHHGKQQTFGERLANDSEAASAEGGADGKLAAPGDGSGKDQIGRIGTGAEKHQADRGHEQAGKGHHVTAKRGRHELYREEACVHYGSLGVGGVR